jgi:hypothetical protein
MRKDADLRQFAAVSLLTLFRDKWRISAPMQALTHRLPALSKLDNVPSSPA